MGGYQFLSFLTNTTIGQAIKININRSNKDACYIGADRLTCGNLILGLCSITESLWLLDFLISFDMKRTSKDDLNSSDPEEEDTVVFVYDRRSGNNPQEKIRLGGIFDFAAFRSKVQQVNTII